jgi:hypothetical protein
VGRGVYAVESAQEHGMLLREDIPSLVHTLNSGTGVVGDTHGGLLSVFRFIFALGLCKNIRSFCRFSSHWPWLVAFLLPRVAPDDSSRRCRISLLDRSTEPASITVSRGGRGDALRRFWAWHGLEVVRSGRLRGRLCKPRPGLCRRRHVSEKRTTEPAHHQKPTRDISTTHGDI